MKIFIPVKPIGAVRMTGRGKWTSIPAQRYLSYKSTLGYYMRKECTEPLQGAVQVRATFYMAIPESYSKKQRADKIGKLVTVKPDIDNLIKGLFDAANGILWTDDKSVCRIVDVIKVYSTEPGISLEVNRIGEESA